MKLYVDRQALRYDIESLAKAIFKEETIEMAGEPGGPGPLLSTRVEKKRGGWHLEVVWDDGGTLKKKTLDIDGTEGSFARNKKEIRNRLKRLMVRTVLGRESRAVLPWGTLTGIKPSKLVHDMLDTGATEGAIRQRLKTDYLLAPEKIDLVMAVAGRERSLIYPPDPGKVSVYIGIPFCPSKCLYCSFPTATRASEDLKNAYLEALFREMEAFAPRLEPFEIETLYIGGGTPTELTSGMLARLIEKSRSCFNLKGLKEFTVEAGRPDTLDGEKLSVLKTGGVDRISINPQTFNNGTLEIIRRGHDAQSVAEAFELVKPYGFESINMDIIVGLPGEGMAEMERTMAWAAELSPDNLTVHTLALKKNAQMRQSPWMSRLPDEKTAAAMLAAAEDGAQAMGLSPYYMYRQKYMLGNLENIGYAKPGKACLYNMQMMNDHQSVIAFGSGAITKFVSLDRNLVVRSANYKQIKDYMEQPEAMARRKAETFKKLDD